MDNMFNEMDKSVKALFNAIDEFKSKSSNSKDFSIDKLLQKKKELDDEIAVKQANFTKLDLLIDNLRNKADELEDDLSSLASRINSLESERNSILDEIEEKESKAKSCKEKTCKAYECEKPDLHEAFIILWEKYEDVTTGHGEDDYVKCFKRFDNLVHARCKSCKMFGYDWWISDVVTTLCQVGQSKIARQIGDFYAECARKKK